MAKKRKTNRRRTYKGNSQAFRLFQEHSWRTSTLLEAGLLGLDEKSTISKGILKKFGDFKAPPGRRPKSHDPEISVKKNESGKVELKMDVRTAKFIKDFVKSGIQKHNELRFHFYGILLVSTWGSLETYTYLLFEELFKLRNQLLISNEQCTYEEVIKNSRSPIDMLIRKQLIKIGRFSINELLEYMESRINLKVSNELKIKLRELYLLRNILAHNSGVVPPSIAEQLPCNVRGTDNNLRITKSYLQSAMTTIRATVEKIERHVGRKFY